MNKLFVSSLLILLLSMCSTAQVVTLSNASKNLKDDYQQADNAYALGKSGQAIDMLQGIVKRQPKFVDGWWLLGKVYFENLQRYDSAAICFDKVKELKPNYNKNLDMMRGDAYMYAGKYKEAKAIFNTVETGALSDGEKNEITNRLKSCDFAAEASMVPKKFNPINLGEGVNTADDELMPSVTADERFVYFTRDEKIGRVIDENIFSSENRGGEFQPAELVGRPISTDEYFEGATCVSPSGRYLFFTSCGRPDAVGDCDIYYTKKVTGGWDRPKNLGNKVNCPGWDIQPCLSADGKTVYFASRRIGGYGGLDIYKTTLGDDYTWSKPENLGPTINTEKDEERPFIHPDDKTLYFSSDGHPGFGHADFFYCKRDAAGHWGAPVNLGFPINTPGEEIGICITTDGNTAYIGSERPEGKGGMDIYKFELDESVQPQHVTYIKGRVFDEMTKAPIKTNIQLFDISNGGNLYGSLTSDNSSGEFLATIPYGNDYACQVSKEGYLFYSANFSLKNFTKNEPYQLDIYLKKIEVGKSVVLNNIFFEVNKYELRDVSKTELNTLVDLMKKNTTMKIELSGHTDNSGIESENKILSENRAKSVMEYLVTNGIEAARLSAKGYGSSKPIADNKTEEGKQKNRRTEFVVTGI
jgi:outer membrane protein OmpA-like peptidoglycan-associated protein/Tol biopolymer transport system component